MTDNLLAFLSIAALVIVTPGQDTALTISRTLRGGRRSGVSVALGVSTGQLVWALAAGAGLSALLLASATAFHVIKYIGAAYLLLLGALALRDAVTKRHETSNSPRPAPPAPDRSSVPYRQGLISTLGNPKVAVFFTGLLPQFGTSLHTLLLFGLAFATLAFLWLSLYATVVARLGDLLRRPRIRRLLDALTGTVLTALGIHLAAGH